MLNKLVTGGVQKAMVCGIYYLEGRATDACPTLQGGDVNAMFSNQGERKYEPYSNMYNEGWRDYPTLRYGPRSNPLGFEQQSCQPSAKDRTNFLLEQVIKNG